MTELTTKLAIEHWGVIDYHEAWARQKQIQAAIQAGERHSTLVLCQHPSVITIGKNGGRHNIVLSEDELRARGVTVVDINRGGDVTLHNPGQLVGYTLFRLTDFRADLHWFLREIEQCIIELLAEYGVKSGRVAGFTGVWLEESRKICAIGIHCSRWVTSHGFALNVHNNLREFEYIIPCGISDKAVTSLAQEKPENTLIFHNVEMRCAEIFSQHFA